MFLKSLLLTILIETIVLIAYFRWIDRRREIKISELLMTGFIASFATLPYLWFVFPVYIDQQMAYILAGESFAVLVETLIVRALLRTNLCTSFVCSLACNMISFLVGVFFWKL